MSSRTPRDINDTNKSFNGSLSSGGSNSLKDIPEQKSPYNSITHGVRRIIPQELACKVGCKGNKCKYDNSDWPEDKMAINGLFSHW